MGFGGGGGGALPAHVHNSVPLQGGPLDFVNDTISSMSAGSTTYSNGLALQELAIGAAGNSLVVNGAATAPEWAAAASGGNYQHVERFTLDPASDVFTCTLTDALNISDFREVVAIWQGRWNTSGSNALECQLATNNGLVTGLHYSWSANVLKTSSIYTSGVGIDNFTVGPSTTSAGSTGNIVMQFTLLPDLTGNGEIFLRWWQTGTNVCNSWGSGHVYDNVGASVSTFNGLVLTNAGGIDFLVDAAVDIYKVTS